MNLVRLRQIATVGGVEIFGVAVGGIAGLLIVNVLPKDQYAIYTFLVACMTLLLGVTDFGLAHCCLPVVGQRAGEPRWVVGACRRVFAKRWVLLALGLFIVVPYWGYATRQHDWSGGAYWLASAMMLAAAMVNFREHYLGTVTVILGHISTINRINFKAHCTRILMVGTVLLLPITPYSVTGVVAASAMVSATIVLLYNRAFQLHHVPDATLNVGDAQKVDAHIWRIARPLVLPAVYYQVQGVITIFLVTLFGTATMLAEVGAFGRLAMVLVVVDRITGILLFPPLARAPAGPALHRLVLKAHSAYFVMMGLMLISAFVVPEYWILLLGEKYRNMAPYVWMMFLASMLGSAAGFAFKTLASRSITARQGFIVPATILSQVLYLWLVGVQDLRSVLGFSIVTALAGFLVQYALLAASWRTLGAAPAQAAPAT